MPIAAALKVLLIRSSAEVRVADASASKAAEKDTILASIDNQERLNASLGGLMERFALSTAISIAGFIGYMIIQLVHWQSNLAMLAKMTRHRGRLTGRSGLFQRALFDFLCVLLLIFFQRYIRKKGSNISANIIVIYLFIWKCCSHFLLAIVWLGSFCASAQHIEMWAALIDFVRGAVFLILAGVLRGILGHQSEDPDTRVMDSDLIDKLLLASGCGCFVEGSLALAVMASSKHKLVGDGIVLSAPFWAVGGTLFLLAAFIHRFFHRVRSSCSSFHRIHR